MKCNLIKMENNQGEKWVKIKYFKQQQIYGDYQASRVIWITTLKNELLIKFNILDKYGNMLYQISEYPESETFDLTENMLTQEQLAEIAGLLRENVSDIEWDLTDEEDIALMLGYFGECLARRYWLARDSRKDADIIVDFIFDSSVETLRNEITQTKYMAKGTTEKEIIEKFLFPKLMEREEMDRVFVTIAEAGLVNSYLVTIQSEK